MDQNNLQRLRQLSPRDSFRESKEHLSKHIEMVDSSTFERAAHTALLQYQTDLAAQVKDGNSAAAVGYKLQGALEIMGVLRNLAEPTPRLQQVANRNLNHQA
jgi:hypothetical protein